MRRFIAWLRRLFRRDKPNPYEGLNRKQRRTLRFARPAEKRMRLERTFLAIAARKRKRGVTKGDHGAKAKRAFIAGYQRGRVETITQLRERLEKRALTWKKAAA